MKYTVPQKSRETGTFSLSPIARGSEIDPSAKKGGITAKTAIDATQKGEDLPKRLRVPPEVAERIKLEDYIK